MLLGLSALVIIGSIGFLATKKIKNQEKLDKVRADNVYFDSLTEKDIAWG